MDLANLIKHPEQLDRETLYDLRGLLALYPYYQTARLLLLQNLFLLHDPSFNEELRNAALYITDRKVIFRLVEAGHYKIKDERTEDKDNKSSYQKQQTSNLKPQNKEDRTISLIDNFLETIPEDEKEENKKKKKRKPTPPGDRERGREGRRQRCPTDERTGPDRQLHQQRGRKNKIEGRAGI